MSNSPAVARLGVAASHPPAQLSVCAPAVDVCSQRMSCIAAVMRGLTLAGDASDHVLRTLPAAVCSAARSRQWHLSPVLPQYRERARTCGLSPSLSLPAQRPAGGARPAWLVVPHAVLCSANTASVCVAEQGPPPPRHFSATLSCLSALHSIFSTFRSPAFILVNYVVSV